jgi:hypothetical protein
MVSAIILSQTGTPAHGENLQRIVEALHSAQVFDIVVVHDVRDRDTAGSMETLAVKPVATTKQHEIARIADGITACQQKELHGVLVVPIAQQQILHGLLVDLLHQFWISHKGIVISRMDGNEDVHIIADTLFGEIRQSSADETLEAFATRHGDQIHRVPFDERGHMILQKQSVAGQQPSGEAE